MNSFSDAIRNGALVFIAVMLLGILRALNVLAGIK